METYLIASEMLSAVIDVSEYDCLWCYSQISPPGYMFERTHVSVLHGHICEFHISWVRCSIAFLSLQFASSLLLFFLPLSFFVSKLCFFFFFNIWTLLYSWMLIFPALTVLSLPSFPKCLFLSHCAIYSSHHDFVCFLFFNYKYTPFLLWNFSFLSPFLPSLTPIGDPIKHGRDTAVVEWRR